MDADGAIERGLREGAALVARYGRTCYALIRSGWGLRGLLKIRVRARQPTRHTSTPGTSLFLTLLLGLGATYSYDALAFDVDPTYALVSIALSIFTPTHGIDTLRIFVMSALVFFLIDITARSAATAQRLDRSSARRIHDLLLYASTLTILLIIGLFLGADMQFGDIVGRVAGEPSGSEESLTWEGALAVYVLLSIASLTPLFLLVARLQPHFHRFGALALLLAVLTAVPLIGGYAIPASQAIILEQPRDRPVPSSLAVQCSVDLEERSLVVHGKLINRTNQTIPISDRVRMVFLLPMGAGPTEQRYKKHTSDSYRMSVDGVLPGLLAPGEAATLYGDLALGSGGIGLIHDLLCEAGGRNVYCAIENVEWLDLDRGAYGDASNIRWSKAIRCDDRRY